MAWQYLSRIFSFSRDASDSVAHLGSQSEPESSPASLPPIASSGLELVLSNQSDAQSPPASPPSITSSIPNNIVEVPHESQESNRAGPPSTSLPSATSSFPGDIIKAPDEPPESNLPGLPPASLPSITTSLVPDDIAEVPNESQEFSLAESPPASLPSTASPGIEHVLLPSQPDTELPPASLLFFASPGTEHVLETQPDTEPPNDLSEALYEPSLNKSELSLLMWSAREPGNKSARKQISAFFKKATRTLRKKQTAEQIYVLTHWNSRSSLGRRSTITLPLSPLAQSSSLSLSSPKIFVDGSAHGVGLIFNDRWLAWTFTPNHPDIVLGRDNNIVMHWVELIAVELGILTLLEVGYRNIQVHVISDNQDVVSALKKKKWTSKYGLDIILARILHLCKESSLELKASWVPTKENPADGPSRGEYPPADMMLEYIPAIPQHFGGLLNQGGVAMDIHGVEPESLRR